MSAGLLFLWVLFVWVLAMVAATLETRQRDLRDPLPHGHQRHMSWAPAIPLYPLAFWGLAKVIDTWAYPWGTRAIASIHLLLGIVFAGGVALEWFRLQRLRRLDAAQAMDRTQ